VADEPLPRPPMRVDDLDPGRARLDHARRPAGTPGRHRRLDGPPTLGRARDDPGGLGPGGRAAEQARDRDDVPPGGPTGPGASRRLCHGRPPCRFAQDGRMWGRGMPGPAAPLILARPRGGMKARESGGRPTLRRALAFFAALAALLLPHAPARAACGEHDARPAIPIELPRRPPACSGPSCSRDRAIPPAATAPKVEFRAFALLDPSSPPLAIPAHSLRAHDGRDGLSPIGRVTEIDRPPCFPA